MSAAEPECHDAWCPLNGCRCGKCGPCGEWPDCPPSAEERLDRLHALLDGPCDWFVGGVALVAVADVREVLG